MQQPRITAKKLTKFAILLALVIVLQVFSTFWPIKTPGGAEVNLTLIPVVLGGMLLGPGYGALLGFAFGLITWIAGLTGASPFTAILMADHPIITTLTCIVKGTLSGVLSALCYKAVAKKRKYVATFVAAAVAPIVNTGLFILGALLMSDTIDVNFSGPSGSSVIYFLVIVCAGVNFLIELGLNLVVSPAIYRVSEIDVKKKY